MNIVITLQPANASGSAGNSFLSSFAPEPLDFGAAASTVYSAFLSKLATLGQTAEEIEQTSGAYTLGVDLPIFSLPFMITDAAQAYGQEGLWGAVKASIGDIEGYLATAGIMDSTIGSGIATLAALAGLPEAGAAAVGVAAGMTMAIVGGYVIGKVVVQGLQYIADNSSNAVPNGNGQLVYPDGTIEASLANGDSQYVFTNGITYTVHSDGTSTASVSGDTYNYNSSNSVTGATYGNGANVNFSSDGKTATVTDAAGITTNLSVSNNGSGDSTLSISNSEISTSLGLDVNSDGQLVATANGNQYGLTLTSDSIGDQDLSVENLGTGASQNESLSAGGGSDSLTTYLVNGLVEQSTLNANGSVEIDTLNNAGATLSTEQLNADGSAATSYYDPASGTLTGTVSSDNQGGATLQFTGGTVALGPGQEVSQTSDGSLAVTIGASGNANVTLSTGDSAGTPIAFSSIESMTLNLDGNYSIVDQSGNAYTLSLVSGSSNYVLSNSSGTVDITIDPGSLSSVSLGQSISLQTAFGGAITVPVWAGSSVLASSNLGDTSIVQGSAISIGINTIDVSSPGSGATQQYTFTHDGTVLSIATYGDSSTQSTPANVTSYDVNGVPTRQLINNSDGTSQAWSWNAANPSADYVSQVGNYSGQNGTGALLNQTTDFTDGMSEIDIYGPSGGVQVTKTLYSDLDGSGMVLSQITNYTNGTSSVTTFATPDSGTDSGLSQSGLTAITVVYSGPDGTGAAEGTTYTTADDRLISDGQIGNVLGSQIGRILGGNSVVASIGLSSVLGGIGEEVGQAIQAANAVGGAGDISETVASIEDSALPDIATTGAGAVGAYLTGELVKDLGITGLPAEIVDTGAGYAISTIASNLAAEAAGSEVAWNAGLSWTSLGGSFAGFAGTELASLAASWSTPAEADGAAIGGDLGAAIGSYFGPIGSFIGGFVGDLLGGLFGSLFGGDDAPNPSTYGQFSVNSSYSSPYSWKLDWVIDNGPATYANSIGNAIVSDLNTILADVGGTISNASILSSNSIQVYANSNQIDMSGVNGARSNFSTSNSSGAVDWFVFNQLSGIQFSGGDVYVQRAIAATLNERTALGDAVNLETLAGNIEVAKDYEKYLENEAVINGLIAENPTSNFSAGWILELEEAASLNLEYGSTTPTYSSPQNVLEINGWTLYNQTASVIEGRIDAATNSGTSKATLSGTGLSLSLKTANSLTMRENGESNHVLVGGNNNVITMNGNYDVLSESGGGNTVVENGVSDSLSMYGDNNAMTVNGQYANIVISGRGDLLTNANGNVTVADNSGLMIDGVAESINMWNGSSLLINGGNMYVDIGGDSNSVTANGNNEQFTLAGNGNSVTGNGQGDAVTVGGTNETITMGGGSIYLADGINVNVNGENLNVDVGNHDVVTLGGQNAGISVNGAGDTVTLNGTSLGISGVANTSAFTLNGSGDSISVAGAKNTLIANGTGDYLTAYGNDNVLVANGQQSIATVSGGGESVTISNGAAVFQNSSTGTVSGTADSINVYNTTQLTVDGGSMNLVAEGGEDSILLNGDDEKVSVQGSSNALTDNGSDNTVTVNGDSDNVTQNGSNEWVTVNGSYDAVQGFLDGTTVTINGTGGAITATGNNDLLIENGTNDYLTVNGNNNDLVANGQQITASLAGANNGISIGDGTVSLADNGEVTVNGASDQINVRNTSKVTANGGSMSLAVNGGQNTLTVNGNVESFNVEGSSNLITGNGSADSFAANGDSNDVRLNGNGEKAYVNGTNNVLAVSGQGNQVTFAGTNNTLRAGGAVAFVLDNSSADFEGGGDSVTVYNDDTVTANGSGFAITETATGSTVTANGDYNTVTLGGNTNAITLNGNEGSVNVSGSLNSVTVSGQYATVQVSGIQQTLAVNQGEMTLTAGSQAGLVGNGDVVTLGASDSLTVNGSNNWVNAAADSTITLKGSGNGVGGGASGVTAVMEGNGQYALLSNDAVNVGAGVQVSLTGTGNAVDVGANSTLDLSGNGNAIQMTGATLVLADSETGAGGDPESGNSESGFKINGFDFSSYNAGDFSSAAGAQSIKSLASTGANSLSLVVTQYVQNVSDVNIEPTSATESDSSVALAIAAAQAQGLSVTLDPHLDIADGTWRAYLAPSDVAQFFANYQAMVVHYAEIAQATGVGMLVIGTEMESLSGSTYEPYWNALIAAVRQVYSGQLTYASGWNETANVSFWNKLDAIGADAYVPVTSETDPTLQQLEAGWTSVSSDSYAASVMNGMSPLAFYESMSAEYNKPLLFTEIGYQSVNDTNQLEGAFGTSNWVDFQQQSQALQAFFSTFSQNGGNWFEGAYLWNWEANPAGVEAGDFSVQGKPGLNIVDYWFGQRAGGQAEMPVPNTLTGDSNSITIGNGDALDVTSNNNQISLGANGAVGVNGQGNTVAVTGGNNLVHTAGATAINLTGSNTTAIVEGDGDSITANGAQDGLAVSTNDSTVTLTGTTDALTLSGNGSTVNIAGTNDTLSVSGTDNTINVSGTGAVIQTSGSNTIDLTGTDSSATVDGGDANIALTGVGGSIAVTGTGATLTIGDGGSSVALDGGNYQLTAGNGDNTITADNGSDVITVGSGTNSIQLGNGNDTVHLGNGADTVVLGSGADAVTLGSGSDTVTLGGNDTLTINVAAGDSTNAASALIADGSTASSQSNELTFSGANSDQLWFSRANNDLLINVIGTASQIDIAGWFDGNPTAVQSLSAADGKLLAGNDVNALVNAMASFSPPTAGSTTLPDSYQNQLQSVIAANWH